MTPRLIPLLALLLAGCAGGEPPAPERATSFDGEVLRLAIQREDGGTERFSTLRDRWFSYPWAPPLPDRSGRRWTMLKTDRDGASIAYALVSWDNDAPTDYLAAGWWLRFPGPAGRRFDPAGAEVSAFVDGPELDPASPPGLPVSGTARYAGTAGGLFRYAPAGAPEADAVAEEFIARMTAEADFAAMTIAACIGCEGDIVIDREHLHLALGWRRGMPAVLPTDYEIRFAAAPIARDGGFAGAAATVAHPERAITAGGGEWHGRLSSRPAADGAPRLAAGQASAAFAEAGGEGAFEAIFTLLHPSLQPEGG